MRNVSQILERKGGRRLRGRAGGAGARGDPADGRAPHRRGAGDAGRQLVGIATERDYARKVILQGRSSRDTPVATIMSAPVVMRRPARHASTECMQIMTERHIRHLPVVDGGHVVGVVSIGDLVKAVIEDQKQEIS